MNLLSWCYLHEDNMYQNLKEVKKILDQLRLIDSHIFQELTILSVLNSSPKQKKLC
jgi:hypothetical protein